MATTHLIPMHIGKGKSIAVSLKDRTDYAKNPDKTQDGEFVSSYECDPRTADAEFLLSKKQYAAITGRDQGERNVLAYQIRQSFKPEEISPEDANRIGYELAIAFTKGRHAFIVATHVDKAHIHSHIIFNSVSLDCDRKFRNFWGSTRAVRRLSDRICLENGLSVIENPKPSRGHYGKWLGDQKPLSYQEKLRRAIDTALAKNPVDFEAFLRLMKTSGYEYKPGKYIAFRAAGQKTFTRCRAATLGDEYTEQAIRERIEGKRIATSRSDEIYAVPKEAKLNLLIDIQNHIKAKNSPGYERWAKVFNLKQAAQTLNFLQEHGLTDYEKLEGKATEAAANFNDLSGRIKAIESRLSEIAELQKHIGNYSCTREVYVAYRKAGYSRSFYNQHEPDILLHQAAKTAFDVQNLKKLPSISELKTEYARLLDDKKKLYVEYRETRQNMRDVVTAKANTDRLLGYSPASTDKENER